MAGAARADPLGNARIERRTLITFQADGRVAQLVRALVSHTRGRGFEPLRDHTANVPRVAIGWAAMRASDRGQYCT